MTACFRLTRPLVVMIVLAGLIVVAAGVLVVALTHIVGHILVSVVGIYIAHKAFFLAAVRAGELLLTFTGQLSVFQLITIISVHHLFLFVV